jgi:putative peptidoglycan lipid II flippase
LSGNEEEIDMEMQELQSTAKSAKRSLLNIATIVAIATLLSKIFGTVLPTELTTSPT